MSEQSFGGSSEVDRFLERLMRDKTNPHDSAVEELDATWQGRARQVEALLAAFEDTLSVEAERGSSLVYVQAIREDQDLMVEAVSNEYINADAVLQPDAVHGLLEMGWEPPHFPGAPNFWRLFRAPLDYSTIAGFLTITLRDGYGVTADEQLSVSPAHLADALPGETPHLSPAIWDPPGGDERGCGDTFPPAVRLAPILASCIPDEHERQKVVHAPQLFGWRRDSATFAEELVAAGAVPRWLGGAFATGEDPPIEFDYDGVTFTMASTPGQVAITLGAFPESLLVAEVLAALAVVDYDRRVRRRAEGVMVELRLSRADGPLQTLLDRISHVGNTYASAFKPGGLVGRAAVADLVDHHVAAGLVIPHIPTKLVGGLRRIDEWWWAETDTPDRMADYTMDSVGWLQRPVQDHVAVSHGGHGLNSYALTWRIAIGPLAMLAQAPWGGAYGDPAHEGAAQARLWNHASQLVHAVEGRNAPTHHPRMRRVLVVVSELRGVLEASTWNGAELTWDALSLNLADPWPQLAKLVGSAEPVE